MNCIINMAGILIKMSRQISLSNGQVNQLSVCPIPFEKILVKDALLPGIVFEKLNLRETTARIVYVPR